ncbi:MAG: hypothetical protein ISP90_06970 [Nevskia sp.]|nr:hypothetical protein [Nevskia sp.]
MKKKPLRTRKLVLRAVLSLLGPCAAAPALAGPAPCDARLAAAIPARSSAAPTGSEFVRRVAGLGDDARESAILDQFAAGNVPQFLRRLAPVLLDARLPGDRRAQVVICVAPDYLAIGSDDDYFLAPMRLETALTVARRFGFVLPTRKMVDAVYAQSGVHLQPQPLPAGDAMRSTAYYWQHNRLVREQRAAAGAPLGTLTAGDKKDLVLTNRLWRMQDRVAIYGWHLPGGRAIQPLSTVHGWRYADYSHGVRLVADTAYVDGTAEPILGALGSDRFAALFSDEGPIPQLAGLIDMLEKRAPPAGL